MKVLRQFAFGILAIAFTASAAVMSFAGDPPSRVARLNYMSGQVSMQPGGVNDWAAATINRPMTTADRLWTDKDSRAELQLGSAAMRMDSNTSLTLSNLNDNTVQVELDQGTLNLDLARVWNGQIYEVDTPNMAFTIEKPGVYRFDVDSRDDTSLVTVWKGKGIATGNGNAVKIDSRKQVRFEEGMSLEHASFHAPHFDGFDEWCQTREDREAHSVSVRYVSPDVIGYQDLDQYGYWRAVPAYGNVWFPSNVVAGWAPYRYGHWVWVDPWGWTWVDDAAWGFAPFHYGRWVTVAGSWAWVPGPVAVHPYYAPALVAWVGSGSAGVGWFPLGYGEPYIPSYHVSRTYFETVNVSNTRITNITYVTNSYYNNSVRINNIHYVNQTTAVTIVNNDVLVNGRRVDRDSWIDHDRDRHDDHDYRVMAGGPSVPPSHQSVLGGDRGRSAVEPPERVFGRRVVTNVKPPERPVAFETRYPDADDHRGHPLNNGEDDRMGKHMPVNPRPDQDARNGNSEGHSWGNSDHRDQQSSSDDRDRHNPVADQRGDSSADSHAPRRGDNDRNNQNSAENNQSAQQHPEHDSNGNDGEHRGNDGVSQSNNPNWNRGQQSDSSAEGRFPHPPRRNDDGQQASNGGSQPAPKQGWQNHNGNDGQGQNGQGQNGQGQNSNSGMPESNNQNGGRGQQGDSSAEGRYPHPPQRGNDNDQQQASSGGPQPAPKQGWQNHNGNDGQGQNGRVQNGQGQNGQGQNGQGQNGQGQNGQGQNNNAGMAQSNNQNGGRGQQGDSSAQGRYPHPPQSGNNNSQQQSASAPYQPAPKQSGQNQNGQGQNGQGQNGQGQNGQGQNNNAGMAQSNNQAGGRGQQGDSSAQGRFPHPPQSGNSNSQQQSASAPYQPAPKQAVQNPIANAGQPQRSNPVGNNGSASNGAQSSNASRNPGSPVQAVDRPVQRPAQAQNSAPQPMQPAPHTSQSQPAPHAQSHPAAPSNAGANASTHGNSFQAHPATPQDH